MRSGRPGGGRHVASRAGRARAERLWQEAVARTPEPTGITNGSEAPHLTPALSSPRGGEGDNAGAVRVPSPPREEEESKTIAAYIPSPPLGAERDREGWGKITSRNARSPIDETTNGPPLPSGPATRKLRALWNSAFHLGLTRDRSDAALVDWLRRCKSIDAETCLSADGLAGAVQPLEAWLARAAGVDWRPHLSFGRHGRVREIHRPRARVLEAQWRLLYRQGRVRIGSHAALGAYAARFAGLGRADSHLALNDDLTDALIRHLGKCIRRASESRG